MNKDVNILTRIQATTNVLTKAEVKVAQYVLSNPKNVLYTSITDLADACNVGDTTVFRFCKTLKLQGYQEFKMLLAQALSSADTPETENFNEVKRTDPLENVTRKALISSTSALNKTFDLIDYSKLSKAVDLLISAGRVLCCGVGSSLLTALEATNKFMRISPKFICNIDSHQQAMSAALLTPNDMVVAISYSGATKDTVEIVKTAKRQGAKVLVITRFEKSPLTSHSNLTLLCGANEGPLQGGSMSGKMSQLFLLDVLYLEYFKRTYDISSNNNELSAASVLEKLY